MTDILQTAAATGVQSVAAADPNTMVAANPATAATPQPAPTIAGEKEQFVDEWAKAPASAPPTRTWVDPSKRTTADGQFLSAWYDTPAQPVAYGDALATQNAAAISQMAPAAAAPAAAPAAPAGMTWADAGGPPVGKGTPFQEFIRAQMDANVAAGGPGAAGSYRGGEMGNEGSASASAGSDGDSGGVSI